jgi:hypothetical protein
MLDSNQDIHSPSPYKRNSHEFLHRRRLSGCPLSLTTSGRAEWVVQDMRSHQRLRERAGAPSPKRTKKEKL